MKWQSEIILFIIFLNLGTGLVVELGFPGTEYVSPSRTANSTDYESHFNATEIAKGWDFPPTLGIPFIGDIYSGFNFLVRMVEYVIVGFPLFLASIGDNFITDPSALVAWNVIKGVLIAAFSILMAMYFVWFISGRDV